MARTKVATMQQVADVVGVSVSTVSRVLNDADFATRQTRDRVIEAASRVGYTPVPRRHAAQPLSAVDFSQGASSTTAEYIVLLAPEPALQSMESGSWIYQGVIPALQRAARDNAFQLMLSSYGRDDEWDPAVVRAEHIGGVIWMAHDREDLLARIAGTVPVVVLNDDSLWPPQTSVMCDNRMVIFKAIDHLVELGHRHIAFFDVEEKPERASVHCRERYAAYLQAVEHFDIGKNRSLDLRETFGVGEHPRAVARAIDRMLELETSPTALVAPLTYAIQFLKETRKRGIAVPRDLSVVAIDNAPAAELVDPSLTVVDCMFSLCAQVAIDLLLEAKKKGRDGARNILMEPNLIVRGSTAPPRETTAG